MFLKSEAYIEAIQKEPWAKGLSDQKALWASVVEWVEGYILPDFLEQMTAQVDEIVEIDPTLSDPEILTNATRHIVGFLGAHSASVRLYDPQSEQMLSYGSFPSKEETRAIFVPLEGSIAGTVVKTRLPCLVPDLLSEDRFKNKEIIMRRGVQSLMAIPLEIPRFFPRERDTMGVIQVYYSEKNRNFSPIEIKMATLMAKRLSFVMARKKIVSMYHANDKKEAIVRQVFSTLETRGGVKLKEVFKRVIPEVADLVNLQSSAFFSISNDLESVILEAGYPAEGGYHSIGKHFLLSSIPAFELLLNLRGYAGPSIYEIVTSSYVLIVDPQRSELVPNPMRKMAEQNNINSILYIPIVINGQVTHFMTFDALAQRQRYRDDEIDLFIFLSRELMKARRMEQLDDALHDFKNPAIATAGFARRLKGLLEQESWENNKEQLLKYSDILLEETSRLQELALSLYRVGDAKAINFTDLLKKRFLINKEAIREQLKQNIHLIEGPFDHDLKVHCYAIHLERIFDNLLNNATKAVPLKGGDLSIRTYGDGSWACAEISNTGDISEEDRLRILEGEGEGRGLYITYRIIRLLKGKITIDAKKGTTTFVVRLPRHSDE